MAIPTNELLNWDNGTPYSGVQGAENTNNTLGELLYWDNGTPYNYIFPVATPAVGGARVYAFIMG